MIELTEQQRRAINEHPEEPLRVVDGETKQAYVLVREELYERFRELVAMEPPTPAEQRALLRAAGLRAHWHDPEMDVYDQEEGDQGRQ